MSPHFIFMLHIVPVTSIIVLILQQSHLLMALLALESVMLSLVLLVPFTLMHSNMPLVYLSVIMLTLGACEAALGLSLLVTMSRSCGSDMLNSLSLNKC